MNRMNQTGPGTAGGEQWEAGGRLTSTRPRVIAAHERCCRAASGPRPLARAAVRIGLPTTQWSPGSCPAWRSSTGHRGRAGGPVGHPDAYDHDDPGDGEAALVVAKNRGGAARTVVVAHQLHYSRFAGPGRRGVPRRSRGVRRRGFRRGPTASPTARRGCEASPGSGSLVTGR
ncbi:Replicative DNA helicase [Pseudonocardia sp. Ae706_Ps2]|nr:Replicative DNA helicase [Pseudonocardia sp. Ae706_Ps2]